MSIESGFLKPKAQTNYPAEKQEPQVTSAVEPSIDRAVHQAKEQSHGEDGASPASTGSQPVSDTSDGSSMMDRGREQLSRLYHQQPNEQQRQNSELANNLSDNSVPTQEPQSKEGMEVNPTSNQDLANQLGERSPLSQNNSSESPNQFAHVENGQPGITIPQQEYDRRQNAIKDTGAVFPPKSESNSELANQLQNDTSSVPDRTSEPKESTNL